MKNKCLKNHGTFVYQHIEHKKVKIFTIWHTVSENIIIIEYFY